MLSRERMGWQGVGEEGRGEGVSGFVSCFAMGFVSCCAVLCCAVLCLVLLSWNIGFWILAFGQRPTAAGDCGSGGRGLFNTKR